MNCVNTERALETHRLALLCHLTGLALLVEFLAFVPVVSMMPQWIRSYALSILVRMEAAAECLVIVSARLLNQKMPGVFDFDRAVPAPYPDFAADEVISNEALLSRIAALKAVLEDLPRYAKRLIRRLEKQRAVEQQDASWPCGLIRRILDHRNDVSQCITVRFEHRSSIP